MKRESNFVVRRRAARASGGLPRSLPGAAAAGLLLLCRAPHSLCRDLVVTRANGRQAPRANLIIADSGVVLMGDGWEIVSIVLGELGLGLAGCQLP